MLSDYPSSTKFKCVCADIPNIALLTKRSIPGSIQVTFCNVSVGENSLVETFTSFTLVGSLESPNIFYVNTKRAFVVSGNNIRLTVTEVLLCAVVGNFERSKKLSDLVSLNTILLPPFLAETAILD